MKRNWETKLPNRSINHINEWADYIELCCLIKRDIVTASDIEDIISDSHLVSKDVDEEVYDESQTVSENDSMLVEDAYSIIQYRNDFLRAAYPFMVSDGCIELKEAFDVNNSIYVFLLLASCTRQVSNFHFFAKRFEQLCGLLSEGIAFNNSSIFVTGTSGSMRGKSVYEKVKHISRFMNSGVDLSFEGSKNKKTPSGGDGGVDVVIVRKFNDDNTFLPTIMGQCTCSRDEWEDKQNDIIYEKWKRYIADIPQYIEAMFLPFSLCGADGKIENPADVRTCVIERFRLIELATSAPEDGIQEIINEAIVQELDMSEVEC